MWGYTGLYWGRVGGGRDPKGCQGEVGGEEEAEMMRQIAQAEDVVSLLNPRRGR